MSRTRTTNKFPIGKKVSSENRKRTLPFNGSAVKEKGFSFSFACFDRTHKLFTLGNEKGNAVEGEWFLELLDCLKSVSNMDIPELRQSIHDFHPIEWEDTNTSEPAGGEQLEYWQFRLDKSSGRVIGFLIDSVFYIVWLDPHHNLTDSEGYPGIRKYRCPKTQYEKLQEERDYYKLEAERQKNEIMELNALLEEFNADKTGR